MTALCFVDTNVLVNWRDGRDPNKQSRAREWLELLWRERRARTSTQVLSEYYSVISRKFSGLISAEEAWRDVNAMLAWAPQPIDAEVLRQARDVESRHRLNWWDCLVVAAAQVQDCDLLLTEDLQDGAHYGGVSVRNPFVLGVAEASAKYAAAPKITSRHRGRGRPRKQRIANG